MLPAKQVVLLKPWLFRPFVNRSQRGPLRLAKIPSMQNILNWSWKSTAVGLPLDCLQFNSAYWQSVFIFSWAIKKIKYNKKLFSNSRLSAEDTRCLRESQGISLKEPETRYRAIVGRAPDYSLPEGKTDTSQHAGYPCPACGNYRKAQFAKTPSPQYPTLIWRLCWAQWHRGSRSRMEKV